MQKSGIQRDLLWFKVMTLELELSRATKLSSLLMYNSVYMLTVLHISKTDRKEAISYQIFFGGDSLYNQNIIRIIDMLCQQMTLLRAKTLTMNVIHHGIIKHIFRLLNSP